MTLKIFLLCVSYFLVVRYLQHKQNNKEVDDIYNVKKKGRGSKDRDPSGGSDYNKSISGSSDTGSVPASNATQPTGPLTRGGF